jgi:predicted short-subunit dehydrogenase-like oxidoreductase (DUF2520 family)
MTPVFGNLLQKAMASNRVDANTVEARDWLRDKALAMRNVDPASAIQKSLVECFYLHMMQSTKIHYHTTIVILSSFRLKK